MDRYHDIVALDDGATREARQGNLDEALKRRGQAVELAKRGDRPRLTAVLFNRLGQLLEARGRPQEATIAYESAIRALEGERDLEVPALIRDLLSVGKGYAPEALPVPDLYVYSDDAAATLEEAASSPLLLVGLLINLGNAYLRQPQDEVALQKYDLALARPELRDAPLLHAAALANRAEILRRRGELDSAEESMHQALALFEADAPATEQRRVLALLAGIDRDRGRFEAAESRFRAALDLSAQTDDALGEGRTRAAFARLFVAQQKYDEARALYQSALEKARQAGDTDTLWHVHWGLGHTAHRLGDLETAATALRESLRLIGERQRELRTDEGKVTFLEGARDVFDELLEVHLALAESDPIRYRDALEVAEEARGRALRDLIGRERRRASLDEPRDMRPSRFRPFNDVASMVAQMAPGVPSEPIELSTFEIPPTAQWAPAIDSRTPAGEPEEAASSPRSSTPALPPLARLVFHVLAERSAIFAVTPAGEVHAYVAPIGQKALSQRVAEVRRAMRVDSAPRGVEVRHVRPAQTDSPAEMDPEPLLRSLYESLVAPVAAHLPEDGTPVVIEPHGPLWLLPFAALQDAAGTWLAEKWPVLYAPSNQVIREIREDADYGDPTTLRALIVGNPKMPTVPRRDDLWIELKPLPGADREAEEVASLFPEERRTLLRGEAATRAAVEMAAGQHGILHLATHGIAFAEDPLASLVALADSESVSGVLTARDAIGWRLPADLVVLSACQSGLGRLSGEGVIGLSRAFLVAGARAVLVSLWSVDDAATARLMTVFYKSYLELDNKALALQHAMSDLRQEDAYADPRFWAPFMVVGAEA